MPNIFISYRRADSKWFAGRLYDRLRLHFSKHEIFFDVSRIAAGDNFVEAITKVISSCDVVLVIIGKKWLEIADEVGRRRIDKSDDFVRLEVQTALQRKVLTIPILIDGMLPLSRNSLPLELADLADIQAFEIGDGSFHDDVELLINRLKTVYEDEMMQQTFQQLLHSNKNVLILGRFTSERLEVLNAIRRELRHYGYIPVLFDFEKPATRDLVEIVTILGLLSRFVIADLTNPSSIPHELMSIVSIAPSVPIQPIISKGQKAYSMCEAFERYPWVLPLYEYESQASLMQELNEKVIQPAEQKANEQRPKPLS